MRFTIWIPKTAFGFLAALASGITIGGVVFFVVLGNPSLDAPAGTGASEGGKSAFVLALILAVAGGSWLGVQLEQRRLERRTRRDPVAAMLDGYLARREAEEAVAAQAVSGQPWGHEAIEQRRRAYGRTTSISTIFDGLNPYFCLSTESLVAYGFTTTDELAELRELVASREFPARWENPMILRDLELLYSHEDAVLRTGLATRHASASG